MQELENLIEKLNTNKFSVVSVFDLASNQFIFRNKSHQEIIEEFGSAEDFFEDLFAKGYCNLRLTLKRKNGNSHKIDGVPFNVNFSTKNQMQTLPAKEIQATTSKDSFSNSLGLGTLDIMNLMVSKNDATRLHTENEILKSENKDLKNKYEVIREEQLLAKYTADKESGLWGAIQGVIANAPALMATFKGIAPVGLASPAENYSSEAKQHFATTLQQIDDSIVNVLDSINNGLNTNNEFTQELAELLKKHQLWQA